MATFPDLTWDPGDDDDFEPSTVTQVELDRAEKAIGVAFPPAYAEFLKKYDGGSFVECVFHGSNAGSLIVNSCFSLCGWNGDPLEEAAEYMKEFLPRGSVPFADDPGGNVFFLDVTKGGQVWFWEHESRTLHYLSEGFREFAEALVPQP
jgi:hypothetical protein